MPPTFLQEMNIDRAEIKARVTLRRPGGAMAQLDVKSPRCCRFSPTRTDEDILEFVGHLQLGGLHSPSSTAKKRTLLGAGIRKPRTTKAPGAGPGRESVTPALALDVAASAVPPWIIAAKQISSRRAMADPHCGATSAWSIEAELKAIRQGVLIAMQPILVLYPQAVETPGGMASQQPPLTIYADTANPCATEAANNHPAGNSFAIAKSLEILMVAALSANRLIPSGFIAGQQIPAGPSRRVEPTEELRTQLIGEEVDAPMFKFTSLLGASRQTALQRVKPDELSKVHLYLSSTSLCKSRNRQKTKPSDRLS